MSESSHCMRAAFDRPNSSHRRAGRSASIGLLIATTALSLVSGGPAHSGPCASQIAQLEQHIRRVASSAKSGPTAAQSVAAQLHHQPTPETVQNAERKADADADAAIQRARQADSDGNPVACSEALGQAKRHWFIPA
jgi:hypothetical protein